jgi:hypothetical protein
MKFPKQVNKHSWGGRVDESETSRSSYREKDGRHGKRRHTLKQFCQPTVSAL